MIDTGQIIYFLFFIVLVIIVAIAAREYIGPLLIAAMASLRNSYRTAIDGASEINASAISLFSDWWDKESDPVDESDNPRITHEDPLDNFDVTKELHHGTHTVSPHIKEGSREVNDDSTDSEDELHDGGDAQIDLLRQYLDGRDISAELASAHNPLDSKDITIAKLRAASKRQISLETFIDKLTHNSLILTMSLDRAPTDLSVSALRHYSTLLTSASEILEKKFADSRIRPADLRELARKIETKIKSLTTLTKLGPLSRDELIVRYAALSGASNQTATNDCRRDLRMCEDNKSVLAADLNSARRSLDHMREEISRGLTSSNCDSLLRDCLSEKRRLDEELRQLRAAPDRAAKLQQETDELRKIANLLQNESLNAQQLNGQQRDQIRHLQDELNACVEMNRSVQTAFETGQLK